jgi:cytochrome P450
VKALNEAILLQMPRKHFPIFDEFCNVMLPKIFRLVGLAETGVGEIFRTVEEQVDEILANPEALKEMKHRTIYHDLVFPATGKQVGREGLILEAQALIFAGSDTVGNALAIGSSYLLNTPGVQERLFEELKAAWPVLDEVPRVEQLEKLPYLVTHAVTLQTSEC